MEQRLVLVAKNAPESLKLHRKRVWLVFETLYNYLKAMKMYEESNAKWTEVLDRGESQTVITSKAKNAAVAFETE